MLAYGIYKLELNPAPNPPADRTRSYTWFDESIVHFLARQQGLRLVRYLDVREAWLGAESASNPCACSELPVSL
jgi:hypothetical protein